MKEVFGWDLAVDAAECNPLKIKDAEHIKSFVKDLVEQIQMVSFGECIVVKFGEGKLEGYSVVQLIQTSCITCHFQDANDSMYLNVFSCKAFNRGIVCDVVKKWFDCKFIKTSMLERFIP